MFDKRQESELGGIFIVILLVILHRLRLIFLKSETSPFKKCDGSDGQLAFKLEELIKSMNSCYKGDGVRNPRQTASNTNVEREQTSQNAVQPPENKCKINKRPIAQPNRFLKKAQSQHQVASNLSLNSQNSSLAESMSPVPTSPEPQQTRTASVMTFGPAEGAAELTRQAEIWRGVEAAYSDATITCFHQHVEGSLHRFKYELIIDSSPAPVVAIARELDLMPTWNKFVSKSKVVETIDSDEKTSFGGIWGYVELW